MAWTKIQTIKNLICLMLVWIGTFTSYLGLDVLQTSINGDIGIYSITLASGCKLFSSFLGPVIMHKVTPKWTVLLSCTCMMSFTIANFYPVWYTLLPAGVLVGLTQGPMWISHGVYVTVMGVEYARLTNTSKDRVLNRISGFAASAIPVAIATGNFLSSVVLKNVHFDDENGFLFDTMNYTKTDHYNFSVVSNSPIVFSSNADSEIIHTSPTYDTVDTCGPHFCPDTNTGLNQTDTGNNKLPNKKAFYIFLGILTCFNIAAMLVAMFGLDNLDKDQYHLKKKEKTSCCAATVAYTKSFFNWKYLLLTPTICFMWVYITFFIGMFPRAYVTCSFGVDMIGYITMSRGIADFVTCITLGLIGQRFPRSVWLFISWFIILGTTVLLLLWDFIKEERHTLIMLFVVSSLSGSCNSINMSQFPAFIGASFTDRKTEVFSFYHFSSSIIGALLYFSNVYICSATQLYMILAFLPPGVIAYIILTCYISRTAKKHQHSSGAKYETVALKEIVQK